MTFQEMVELTAYVEKRQRTAAELGMDYDIETDKFIPYSTNGSAREWETGDNEANDPEQNWDKD